MPIEFDKEDKKKKAEVKRILIKTGNIFANCKRCNRPYKKGKNYLDEVCSVCEAEE